MGLIRLCLVSRRAMLLLGGLLLQVQGRELIPVVRRFVLVEVGAFEFILDWSLVLVELGGLSELVMKG